MVNTSRLTTWFAVHKWTSLICTVFLFVLCLTGLPLIFHEEIEEWQYGLTLRELPANTPVDADRALAAARAWRPQDTVQYLIWDVEEPAKLGFALGATATATDDLHTATIDGRTGEILATENANEGIVAFLLKLHTDMFLGLPGKLFLGLMGMLFVAATVSGVVLYAPFMRNLTFGTIRREKSRRLYWLDLHNLLGIATLVWTLVVGGTGVINTWADLVLKLWQYGQLSEMVAPYKNDPPLDSTRLAPVQQAVETALHATPGMIPSFVAFPGTMFSSQHHYAVFMRGRTPLTTRLLKPVLVDAQTAELTASRALPWYVTTLLIAQPLHFGDYGGLPLKIVWACLDIVAIVVLGSGLYLWWGRRKRSLEFEFDLVTERSSSPTPFAPSLTLRDTP